MDERQLQDVLNASEKERRVLERKLRALERRNEILKYNFNSQTSVNKAIELERARQETYVKLLLRSCPDIIMMFDRNMRFLLGTDAVSDVISIKKVSDLHEMTLAEIISDYSPAIFTSELVREISDKERSSLEIHAGGANYKVNILPFHSSVFDVVLVVIHDITDLIEAKNMAEQASAAKGEFLSRMSHEMRTPLNAISGMVRIARQSEDPARREYCLAQTEKASVHLLNVINDVLDLSKIEANKMELHMHPFDLRKTISDVAGVFYAQVEENSQIFSYEIDETVPYAIIGDELRFTQVVTNLLTNARKFTPDGGSIELKITVVSENESPALNVEVNDTGIGISDEQQKRLFVAFEQAESGTSRLYGGSGLGLAICKRIIDIMGGTIQVESKLHKGAKFTFTMPFTASDMPLIAENKEETPPDLSGHTIMVAEDSEINREILSAVLEETNVEIVFAKNGLEAVSIFNETPCRYSLILMDIQMPFMDGVEATRTIRSIVPHGEKIPIIAMTANVFHEDIERYFGAGMNAHLGKPIDHVAFFDTLEKYILLK